MIALREAAAGLYGAWRLAHLDRSGHRWFDISPRGVVRSFWGAAIAAPAYFLILLLRLEPEADAERILVAESLAYVISWTAFPLVAEWLVRIVDRASRFGALVCTYNWVNTLSIIAQGLVGIVLISELLPGPLDLLLRIAVLLAIVGYHGFAVRTALDVGWGAAIGFVLADLAITVLVTRVAQVIGSG